MAEQQQTFDAGRVIAQTQKWIVDVVVGLQFCPFAAREVKRNSIGYEVLENASVPAVLAALRQTLARMNEEADLETVLLILPGSFHRFAAYLALVAAAESRLRKEGHEGRYQLASFHPDYQFAGSSPTDPANYTNRSPYAMLHILREESVSRAVDAYPEPHRIPEKNTALARQKGLAAMQALRAACLQVE